MIYEIINPSDTYSLEADDPLVAVVTALFLGHGQYGLRQLDGDFEMPIFLFGGHDKWFMDVYGKNTDDTIRSVMDEKKLDVISCLESVTIGGAEERKMYYEALNLIDGEENKQIWRDKWHDTHRSSLNDIGGRALELAKALKDTIQ